jgi:molybdenum cofactor cytidylyltransferase
MVTTMKTPTAGIVLAAGQSTRFGKPKQLVPLNGRLLIEWALEAALGSKLDRVVLVLGCEHERIRRCLRSATAHSKCEIVVNPDYLSGQSTSLKTGLLRVRHEFQSVMFLLGDQPLVDAPLIDLLLERYLESEKTICVPTYRAERGNPTIFGSAFYPELLKLSGDKGARDLISAHPDDVIAVEIAEPALFHDIDRPEDVETAMLLQSRRPFGRLKKTSKATRSQKVKFIPRSRRRHGL